MPDTTVAPAPAVNFEDLVEIHECTTFEQFEQILSSLGLHSNKLVFRGHPNHQWSVSSSLERFILEIAPPNEKLNAFAKAKAIASRLGLSEKLLLPFLFLASGRHSIGGKARALADCTLQF